MFYSWLDRWDERRASRGDEWKKATTFALDTELAFPGTSKVRDVRAFCSLSDLAARDPSYFDVSLAHADSFDRRGEWLTFQSVVSTDVESNNLVWSRITESGSKDQVVVVFHHWNATKRNNQIARFFSRRGVTVVEIAMPYHFERRRPGSDYADYMLSANLGRTLQAVRQAVLDGRKMVQWLQGEGYGEISVLGMSLGSWVAGLVAAHDRSVSKASLLLSAGSLADMVWTGRATRAIRETLAPQVSLEDLRRVWAPLNLEHHADHLARSGLKLQVILANRDNVVLPTLSERFVQKLRHSGAAPDIFALNCGHYSFAMPPYGLLAGLRIRKFLAISNLAR